MLGFIVNEKLLVAGRGSFAQGTNQFIGGSPRI